MKIPPLVNTPLALNTDEMRRYSRQTVIPDVSTQGQGRLKNAKVVCIGAGGLGSPILMYLASAGVGTIGIVEFDTVDESNLQRQIIYGQGDVGKSKVDIASKKITEINPLVNVITHNLKLDNSNAMEIFKDYDLVIDGTDNFATRYLINDACVILNKPCIWGSVLRFDGQVSVSGLNTVLVTAVYIQYHRVTHKVVLRLVYWESYVHPLALFKRRKQLN